MRILGGEIQEGATVEVDVQGDEILFRTGQPAPVVG